MSLALTPVPSKLEFKMRSMLPKQDESVHLTTKAEYSVLFRPEGRKEERSQRATSSSHRKVASDMLKILKTRRKILVKYAEMLHWS